MSDEKWRLHERRPRIRSIDEIKKYSDDLTELFRNKVGEDLDLILFEMVKAIATDRKPFLLVLKHKIGSPKNLTFKKVRTREEADTMLLEMNSAMSAFILGAISKDEAIADCERLMR